MIQHKLNLAKAYSSLLDEMKLEDVALTGDLPSWLAGSFISIGPAQFEVGQTHFKHWFDGFAMLKKFRFKEGRISFQNRFLQSKQFIKSNKLKRLQTAEFGTPENLLDRIHNLIKRVPYDNCNVNTTCIADNYIAMTESSEIFAFDPHELNTLGPFHFDNDNIKCHLSLAHPHQDITTGEIININIEIGKTNQYHIYKIKPHSKRREIIQTYLSDRLFYIHSFALTPNFIILTKSPLTINKVKLMLGLPFNDTLWQKDCPFYFVLIDRRNGNIKEIEADPFFVIHTINGFERGNEVVIDLICYKNKANPYDMLYLSNLKSAHPQFMPAIAKRYIIKINANRYQEETFSNDFVEFPRIHYKKKNGMEYEFVYTNLMQPTDQLSFNAIQKLNVQTGESMIWKNRDYYPGEAVFVPKPDSQREDEGILLSIAYNIKKQLSSLVILDALSMQQIAQGSLPFHLPLGIHGNFYRAIT